MEKRTELKVVIAVIRDDAKEKDFTDEEMSAAVSRYIDALPIVDEIGLCNGKWLRVILQSINETKYDEPTKEDDAKAIWVKDLKIVKAKGAIQ